MLTAAVTVAPSPVNAQSITSIDAPGAGMRRIQGTISESLDPLEEITGHYFDTYSLAHGFVRDAKGTITSFGAPVATGTFPLGINSSGVITSYYRDGAVVYHGFVRIP